MRLTFVLPSLAPAGMETMALSLAGDLGRRGHELAFVCTTEEGALATEARAKGIPVWPEPPSTLSAVRPRALRVLLEGLQPDVVHIHGAPWFKSALAARQAGVMRLVHTIHGLPTQPGIVDAISMRSGAALTDAVIAVTTDLADFARRRLAVPESRLRIVLNGVDTNRFAPHGGSGLRQTLGLREDTLLVGAIARLDPVKNHGALMDAFAQVARALPHTHLVLIGDGSERQRLEALTHALKIQEQVTFCGIMADPSTILPDLDVVALTSRAEGLPMAVLEAMAAERPVVATAVGGLPELLSDDAGRSVPVGDVVGFAEALKQLLVSPEARKRMGGRARAKVVERYSLDRMTQDYELVYEELF